MLPAYDVGRACGISCTAADPSNPLERPELPSPTLPISQPVLIVAIAIAIFLLAPIVVERFRLPGIVGLIVAGAIVGPNGLNLLARDNTIILLGTVGLLYLMFTVGVEIDLHGFRKYRNRSVVFGLLSFALPQVIGASIMRLLGYGWATSILLASMFGSHTLLAYPIARGLGLSKNPAVTTAVGGTMVTDTAALLVLAIVAASTRGVLDAAFWGRLGGSLVLYVLAVWFGLPRIARWFFRVEKTGAGTEYLFVMLALFSGAWLAQVAGVEPIVGAFLVGLSLNRLIPETSVLAHRIHFFGDTFFIPFFLLSVGMLVDVRVLAGGVDAWVVMIAMIATLVTTKLVAAKIAQRLYGYTSEEGWTMYGLTVGQAAATLAAALVGVQVGLVDDTILNGVIVMILVAAIIGPTVVEKYGRVQALRESENPVQQRVAVQRILVPIAKPTTAPALMDLALAIREPDSDEPILPLTVVPADEDRAGPYIALGERMLSHAVAHAAGVGVPAVPLTRVDHNFASGIARGALETQTTTMVIGWDGRRTTTGKIFGTVLDQLLQQTDQQLLVAKLGHPLNTTRRLMLLIPRGTLLMPGFLDAVRTVKLLANRLGAEINGFTVGVRAEHYTGHLAGTKPEAPVVVEEVPDWPVAIEQLGSLLAPDDLVIVMAARRGSVAWSPSLEVLPAQLAELVPESFVMLYLAESVSDTTIAPESHPLVQALAEERVRVGERNRPFGAIIRDLLEPTFAEDSERLDELVEHLSRKLEDAQGRLRPDVVVPHLRVDGLDAPMLFAVTSPEGISLPRMESPAHMMLVLLTPAGEAGEHLRHLAAIAHLVSDDARVRALVTAETAQEFREILARSESAEEALI